MGEKEKNKRVCSIVLFLLSILLLIGTLFLQMHSKKIKADMVMQKEFSELEDSTVKTTSDTTAIQPANTENTSFKAKEYTSSSKTKTKKSRAKTTTRRAVQYENQNHKPSAEEHSLDVATTLGTTASSTTKAPETTVFQPVYVLTMNTHKIHNRSCPILQKTNPEKVKEILNKDVENYLFEGYTFCSKCCGGK